MNPSRSLPVRTSPRVRRINTPAESMVGSNGESAARVPQQAAPAVPPMSLEEIMRSEGRLLKPRLHPRRPNRPTDVWFSIDDCIKNDISSIYTNDFNGPWRCLTMVPEDHQIKWWSKFVQRYFWEDEHHAAVMKSYRKQLRDMIKNVISKAKRDVKKPAFLDEAYWKLMLQFWETPQAQKRSKNCSEARKSPRLSYGKHRHTAGSKSFNKIAHEMAEANNGIMPSIPELIKRTHTKPYGTFVDKYAEKIVEEVQSLATQMSTLTMMEILKLEAKKSLFKCLLQICLTRHIMRMFLKREDIDLGLVLFNTTTVRLDLSRHVLHAKLRLKRSWW